MKARTHYERGIKCVNTTGTKPKQHKLSKKTIKKANEIQICLNCKISDNCTRGHCPLLPNRKETKYVREKKKGTLERL